MTDIPVFESTEEAEIALAVAHPTCNHALVEQFVTDEDAVDSTVEEA